MDWSNKFLFVKYLSTSPNINTANEGNGLPKRLNSLQRSIGNEVGVKVLETLIFLGTFVYNFPCIYRREARIRVPGFEPGSRGFEPLRTQP